MPRAQEPLTTFQQITAASRSLYTSWRGDNLPPGPGTFPHIGVDIAKQLKANPLRTLLDFYDTYGPAFTTRFLGTKQVWLIGPEANHTILVKQHSNFSWSQGHMGDLIPFIGEGLLTTDGHTHDRARKLMQPLFRKSRMERYSDEMLARTQQVVQQLRPGQEIEIYQWTRALALELATHILFGIDTNPKDCEQLSHQFERGLGFYGAYFHLQFLRGPKTPHATMMSARKQIDKVIYGELKRRRKEGSQGENIMDLLLHAREDQEQFSDQEIRDQIVTLLFAGHDTTTATVSWAMSLLGQHRHAYERLQAEIDETLQGRPPTFAELNGGLPYLDQVLAETLRLYPPAWIGPRMALDDFDIYGYTIPGGTRVSYSSWLSHRLPEIFPNPEMFDPDRMTTAKIKALPAGAYVPFGWGPRLCIGKHFGELEVKIILIRLLQQAHFELLPGQLFAAHTMPTISPKEGVRMWVRDHP